VDVVKFIKFLKTKVERERELISDSLVDGRISKEDYEKSLIERIKEFTCPARPLKITVLSHPLEK
jgi:hypothetical protein